MSEIKQKSRVGVDAVKQKGRAGVDTVRATIKKKTPTSLPTRSLFVHTPRTWYGSKIKVPKDKEIGGTHVLLQRMGTSGH